MHQTLENRKFSKQFVKSNEAIKGGKAVSLVLHFFLDYTERTRRVLDHINQDLKGIVVN